MKNKRKEDLDNVAHHAAINMVENAGKRKKKKKEPVKRPNTAIKYSRGNSAIS